MSTIDTAAAPAAGHHSSPVQEACGQIAGYLPILETLVAEPGCPPGGSAGMTPRPAAAPEPWDAAAGHALMDVHEGIRRLEAALRYAVTGHPGQRRGGSPGNTAAALTAIPKLAAGLGQDAEAAAARILDRWSRQTAELPAVDEAEPWRPLHGIACPYCGCAMLRVRPREGTITCLRYGACHDTDGHHPLGRLDISRLTGNPLIRWHDGLVAP